MVFNIYVKNWYEAFLLSQSFKYIKDIQSISEDKWDNGEPIIITTFNHNHVYKIFKR